MKTNSSICSNMCCGIKNHHGQCCYVGDGGWMLGKMPDKDVSLFIKNLSEKFEREVKYEEVFVEYDEGHKLFPDNALWQDKSNYPSIRVDMESDKRYCIFYNKDMRMCSVYDIRPTMCRYYECDYLKNCG